MYNPPRKEINPTYNPGYEYHEEYLMVYEQGRESAKQKKPFANPYHRTVARAHDPYGYNLTHVRSFEDDLCDWYYNGYYDYQPGDDNPKLKMPKALKTKAAPKAVQVPVDTTAGFDVYFPPAGEPRGGGDLKIPTLINPKPKKFKVEEKDGKKTVRRVTARKRLNMKVIEEKLEQLGDKTITIDLTAEVAKEINLL